MKGLNSRFKLTDGSIHLSEGMNKLKDEIWFYGTYNRFYPYDFSFGSRIYRYNQKSVSFFNSYSSLIITELKKGIESNTNIKVDDIDIGYLNNNRKEIHFKISFSTKVNNNTQLIQGVQFI